MTAVTSDKEQGNKEKLRVDWDEVRRDTRDFFVHAVGQIRILKKFYPGIMHFLIFWGVTIQVIGTAINLMQMALFTPFALENFPRGNWYLFYEFIMDLAGVFILIGVTMAFIRRIFMKPKTLGYAWDDWYALILLTILPLAGFTTEAMRLIVTNPAWAGYSFMGNLFAGFYRALGITPTTAFGLQQTFVLVPYLSGADLRSQHPFYQAAPPDLCATKYRPPPTQGNGCP